MEVFAKAYAIKAEAGGGYRGVAVIRGTDAVERGEVRAAFEHARFDAQTLALRLIAGRPYRKGLYNNRAPKWACNYYVEGDMPSKRPQPLLPLALYVDTRGIGQRTAAERYETPSMFDWQPPEPKPEGRNAESETA